jgi:hypothetical protein
MTEQISNVDDAQTISGVGPATAEELEVETVAELASLDTDEAINRLDNDDINEEVVVGAVREAREAVGAGRHESVDLAESSAEQADPDDVVESKSGSELMDRYEEPSDELTVAVVAGSGAFDEARAQASGNSSEVTIPGMVADRLEEAGYEDPDALVVPDPELGDELGQGFAVLYAQDPENDVELNAVGLNVTREQTSDWESDDWAQAFQQRRQTVLEEADAVVVVRNGDGVGVWVNETVQMDGVTIDTPEYEPDSEDSEDEQADPEDAVEVAEDGVDEIAEAVLDE